MFQPAGSLPIGQIRMVSGLPWFVRNMLVKLAMRRGQERLILLLGHHDQTFPY